MTPDLGEMHPRDIRGCMSGPDFFICRDACQGTASRRIVNSAVEIRSLVVEGLSAQVLLDA